ncbi:MAG TPA: hypothetical protein VGE74_28235 [Gemmata sp.]
MSKISGHGGYLILAGEGGNSRVENSTYESDVDAIIDDVTDSGSEGAAEGLPIMYKVNALVMEVFDTTDANFAIALGITEGQIVNLWAKRGAAATGDLFEGTIVRNVHTSNPQTATRRIRITCEYGWLTRNAAAPSLS